MISKVVHKAFVETNEEGSEAAAATGVAMRTWRPACRRSGSHFRADRPFLFVIRDVTDRHAVIRRPGGEPSGVNAAKPQTALARPVSVNVLDRRLVAPRDLLAGQTEHCRDLVALVRARRPSAEHDRRDPRLIQPGPFGELCDAGPSLDAQLIDVLVGSICSLVSASTGSPQCPPPAGCACPTSGRGSVGDDGAVEQPTAKSTSRRQSFAWGTSKSRRAHRLAAGPGRQCRQQARRRHRS